MLTAGVIGNCQGEIIHDILKNNGDFTKVYNLIYCAVVHKITREQLLSDYESIVANLDLIIIHNISDNYRKLDDKDISIYSTTYLKSIMKAGSQLIIVPNMYFSGYFPSACYLKDKNNLNIEKYDITYHDYNIIDRCTKYPNEFDENLEYCINKWYNIHEYSRNECLSLVRKSIEHLKQRERFTDIVISDFISNNYTKRRLFNTFNHPTTYLTRKLAQRICDHLGIVTQIAYNKATLNKVIFAIHPAIVHHLQLRFEDCNLYYFKDEYHTVLETITIYLNYYSTCISYDTMKFNRSLLK